MYRTYHALTAPILLLLLLAIVVPGYARTAALSAESSAQPLENPYPFHASLRFDFGIFAGVNPKCVAFWYQLPRPQRRAPWAAPDPALV